MFRCNFFRQSSCTCSNQIGVSTPGTAFPRVYLAKDLTVNVASQHTGTYRFKVSLPTRCDYLGKGGRLGRPYPSLSGFCLGSP